MDTEVQRSVTLRVDTGNGTLHVVIVVDADDHAERIFVYGDEFDPDLRSMSQALGGTIAIGLRAGATLEDFASFLSGIRAGPPRVTKGGTVHSVPDAIAKAFRMAGSACDCGKVHPFQVPIEFADSSGENTGEVQI